MKSLKKPIIFLILISLIVLPCYAAKTAKNIKGKAGKHPVPMEDQNCLSCHEGSVQHAQWEKSGHGLGLVKCEVCHGEESTFRKTPSNEVCRGCHSDKVDSIAGDKTGKTACVSCHPAHTFNNFHKAK